MLIIQYYRLLGVEDVLVQTVEGVLHPGEGQSQIHSDAVLEEEGFAVLPAYAELERSVVELLEGLAVSLEPLGGVEEQQRGALGLDDVDIRYLRGIIERFRGGPVGLEAIASAIGEETITLEDVNEPYLLPIGFINRTPRGRVATANAYKHLGMAYQESFEG